jgi:hypothetical protein
MLRLVLPVPRATLPDPTNVALAILVVVRKTSNNLA